MADLCDGGPPPVPTSFQFRAQAHEHNSNGNPCKKIDDQQRLGEDNSQFSANIQLYLRNAKLRSKIARNRTIGEKVCAHHFVQIAEGFEEKNPPQMFRAKTVYVHLYKIFLFIFSARRYIALTASAKFRIPMGNSKIARNEQVCAHQKSYRRKFFPHLFQQMYT